MLRFRLSLLVTLTVLAAIVAFGGLAEYLFVKQQVRQLEIVLTRDLERIQALVETSTVGQRFVDDQTGAFILQFASRQGKVVIPPDTPDPLPLHETPTFARDPSGKLIVSSVPWRLPSGKVLGTIRLAFRVDDALAVRQSLLASLLSSGGVIFLIAVAASLFLLQRTLSPLLGLAKQAEQVDPTNPEIAVYSGPNDEVAKVAQALNRALAGIRVRQQSERDALAEIAHELAAPLSVVAGQLNALTADQPTNKRLRAARDAANELLYTSQDLLALARGELERPPDFSATDLSEVIVRLTNEYPGLHTNGVFKAEVLANFERLMQAVRNLVRNAVQVCGDAEKVTLSMERDDEHVRLSVRDTGPGLSQKEQGLVFERYYSNKRGAGVGLNVAKKIIEQHEGRLTLESEPGRGTCFTISLPRLENYFESS